VEAGYDPVTVVAAVQGQNMGLLKHTGLTSVRLQEPKVPPPSTNGNPQDSRPPSEVTMDIDIVRALEETPTFRKDSGDGLGTLTGHFSVFDSWYPVSSMFEGDFLERVAPGAFAQTITEDVGRMRVLFDHGYDPQIGNKVLGSIESLSEDDTGPAYEVRLLDTGYNRDLVPRLQATQMALTGSGPRIVERRTRRVRRTKAVRSGR
jgi:HK97 family phage prohead protease